MMTERQRKFREQYVANISPWYNGLVHVIVTFGVGIAAIAWCVGILAVSVGLSGIAFRRRTR